MLFNDTRKVLNPKLIPNEVPYVADERLLETARERLKSGDASRAYVYYQRALLAMPDNSEAILGAAAAADLTGQFDTSGALYDLYKATFGETFEYHNNIGYSYTLQAKYKDAKYHLLEAIRLNPNADSPRNNFMLLSMVAV